MKLYRILLLTLITACAQGACAQVNISSTDTVAAQVMLGNYDPVAYTATTVISAPDAISGGIQSRVSPDSLHAYLDVLRTFKNRNTAADTVSSTIGIGAARRWVYSKLQQFSAQNDHRLIPSYLQFDMTICTANQHRNIFAVLPGSDTSDKSMIIVEGHIDSRCSDVCDTACQAQGIEDNASGTALVLELARVMSTYSYKRTIVFLVTIGEEQGLYGAQAFAKYVQLHGMKIHGVLNNDVIGGIFCGHTASAPGCPGYADIDSTQVRLFSYGGFNSFHKGLARFVKLEYKEMVLPFAAVPMTVSIMTAEDRTGRGGDHIPFDQLNYSAIRFTAANEDGDANVTSPTYTDRQHTSGDSLGVDLDGNGTIDQYYVDFDYLARNSVINGNAAAMMAVGPLTPDFTLTTTGGNLIIDITQHPEYLNYRVGVRSTTYDWDSVYTFTGTTTDTIYVPNGPHIVSVASVDANGVESLFSRELNVSVNAVNSTPPPQRTVELMQNKPNPADEATMISVLVNDQVSYTSAFISIRDMAGKEVKREPITLNKGMNELVYEHGYNRSGTFIYTLVIDGREVESKKMVFTN
jgi:hypothetical protein